MIDIPKVTGMVTLTHKDEFGNILKEQTVKNLVVNSGLNHIAARLAVNAGTGLSAPMSHMALGESNKQNGSQTSGVAASDTALSSQAGSRVSLATAGGTVNNAQVTYTATFGAGAATGTIVEAGIFNASTSGTMLCRTVFDSIAKGVNDSLTVTWVITVS